MAGFNGIGWFEIGTSDPDAAKQFYGDVFGWTASDEDPASSGPTYQIITTGDPDGPRGGLFATEGKMPGYAVFTVLVEDVEATCRRAEQAGGKVHRPMQRNPLGVTFAYLLDPEGNQLGVFTPPAPSGG